MGELDLKELNKVSGGVADNILLYWGYWYAKAGYAKDQWTTLATRYCLSEAAKVKEIARENCKKDNSMLKSLYYRQANTKDWIEYKA